MSAAATAAADQSDRLLLLLLHSAATVDDDDDAVDDCCAIGWASIFDASLAVDADIVLGGFGCVMAVPSALFHASWDLSLGVGSISATVVLPSFVCNAFATDEAVAVG